MVCATLSSFWCNLSCDCSENSTHFQTTFRGPSDCRVASEHGACNYFGRISPLRGLGQHYHHYQAHGFCSYLFFLSTLLYPLFSEAWKGTIFVRHTWDQMSCDLTDGYSLVRAPMPLGSVCGSFQKRGRVGYAWRVADTMVKTVFDLSDGSTATYHMHKRSPFCWYMTPKEVPWYLPGVDSCTILFQPHKTIVRLKSPFHIIVFYWTLEMGGWFRYMQSQTASSFRVSYVTEVWGR